MATTRTPNLRRRFPLSIEMKCSAQSIEATRPAQLIEAMRSARSI
jgi:hypothetical protein